MSEYKDKLLSRINRLTADAKWNLEQAEAYQLSDPATSIAYANKAKQQIDEAARLRKEYDATAD